MQTVKISTDREAIEHVMKEENMTKSDVAKKAGFQRQYMRQILEMNKGGMRANKFIEMMDLLGYEVQIVKK